MEYIINCTEWNKEKIMEIFSALPPDTNAKIILYTGKNEREQEKTWEKIVGNYLNKMGISPHLKGYGYLKYGVARCIYHSEELESITKSLYPGIAKKYNTTSGRVEHGIRHAIQKAWNCEKSDVWENIFGKEYMIRNSKPTNSQFIATLSDFIMINN